MIRPFPKRASSARQPERLLDRAQKAAQIFSLVAIPIVVAFFGWQIQRKIAEDATRQKYVELAIGVLREKPTLETLTLRRWAAQTLARYSSERFTGEELAALQEGRVLLPKADSTRVTADSTVYLADGDGSLLVDGDGTRLVLGSRPTSATKAQSASTPVAPAAKRP